VDGRIDAPVQERLLELLDEDTPVADLAEGTAAVAVARRRDRHQCDLSSRLAEAVGGQRRLRQREPAAA
jgi:hypothetical protein